MKYLYQSFIILIIYYIGGLISKLINDFIVIPGSIIGMLLLLLLLSLKIIKISHVEETSQFLLNNMGFFFIPLGVSLIESFQLIKDTWISIFILLMLSCTLVMGITSKITEMLILKNSNKTKGDRS